MKKKMVKRFLPLILLLLFLIPFQAFFLTINTTVSSNEALIEQDDEIRDFGNPKTSALDYHSFAINGTELYENATFYLYQDDTLFFSLTNPILDSVSNVDIDVEHPIDGSLNFGLGTTDNQEWNVSYTFSYSVASCPSTLTYSNGTDSVVIDFTLDIAAVTSKILNVYAKDTTYNNEWTEIVEGGVYTTYRNTDFSFGALTEGRDAAPSSLTYNYSDGIYSYGDVSTSITATSVPQRTFNTTSAISILVNTTSGGENQWRPKEELYKFILNLDDVYFFEFFIEIRNKAPEITQFDLTPSSVENPSGSRTSVDVILNASDFEDDILYEGGTLRTAKYTDPITRVKAESGCTIEGTDDVDNLKERSDEEYYNLTMGASGGSFITYMEINNEIVIESIDSFAITLNLKDDSAGDGNLQIYNYGTGAWESFRVEKFDPVFKDYVNYSSELTGSIEDYLPLANKTAKFNVSYTQSGSVQIDYWDMTFSVSRRDTFSRIILDISNPTGADSLTREIINYWDDTNDYWTYQFNISNSPVNYGSWTFSVYIMDHGSTDYIETIWGNFSKSGDSSSSRFSYPYQTGTAEQNGMGYAFATKVFTIGIPAGEALNISSIPTINTASNEIDHTQTFNISILVDGIDTSNPTEKDYVIRNSPTGFLVQKNATETNSTSDVGFSITSNLITQGKQTNITDDDGDPWSINLATELTEDWRYHTLMWQVRLENWDEINYQNITDIYIDLDSGLNNTGDVSELVFEFWNYTSGEWTTPSTGTWNDISLRNSGSYFTKTISDANDISHLVDSSSFMLMRLKLTPNSAGDLKDFELSIDYLNISTGYNFIYITQMDLLSSELNGYIQSFELSSYAVGPWTMQYSYELNINTLNLEPENFVFRFIIKNGNSSLVYETYRKSNIIVRDTGIGVFKSVYFYEQSAEVPYLNKNFTISINEPITTVSEYLTTFENIRISSGATTDSKLFYLPLNYNGINVSADIDLSTIDSGNNYLDLEVQIREGLTEKFTDWRKITPTLTATNEFSYTENVDAGNYGEELYYIRFYMRTSKGAEYATEWKQYRIINYKPHDFSFSFDNGQPLDFFRGETYDFTFSFRDYDMTNIEDNNAVEMRFKIYNKTSDQLEWLEPTSVTSNAFITNGRHSYSCSIDIPKDTRTGATNDSYFIWEFVVTDNNGGFESQVAYLNFSNTEFIIKNNPVSINNLDVTTAQIRRNNALNITFDLTDDDEPIPILMEVLEFNITTPGSMPDWISDNSSVKYDPIEEYRFNTTFIERTAELGRYNISIKVVDADGDVAIAETYFEVLNNAPTIEAVWFSESSVERNLDDDNTKSGPITMYVNVTDIEDSWIQTKGTNQYAIEQVNLTLTHETEYRDKIQAVSPNTDPIDLTLELWANGNSQYNHIETWNFSLVFNNTMWGQKFYAGLLETQVRIKDSDGRVVSGSGSNLEILNNAPQLIQAEIPDLGMEEARSYYFKNSIKAGDDIEFYIFAEDEEPVDNKIKQIKLWYYPLIGSQEIKETLDFITFTADNWQYEEMLDSQSQTVPTYKITLDFDDLPEFTSKIELNKIFVYDTDYSYKDDSNQGKTLVKIEEFEDEFIVIEGAEEPPSVDWVIYIFMGIGIAAIVGVVIGGIVYYRKKSGWRKFLD